MDYKYDRKLFREFLAYPNKSQLTLFEDRKRLEKLELKTMDWINNKSQLIKKEFTLITKNWWSGAKVQALENLLIFSRNKKEFDYLTGKGKYRS